jgi:serine/threonine-protein kinase
VGHVIGTGHAQRFHKPLIIMPSEDPIRIDASTVHRAVHSSAPRDDLSGREEIGNDQGVESADQSSPASGKANDEEISKANTVIRGSSRVEKPKPAAEIIDRTPAAVTKGLLGAQLNHFHLEAFIGGGGMGAVFKGHDEQLDRTVAIKVIPFVGDDPDLQRRFRNEAQSAAKLDHPRIARVFDVGSHGDWHYIVFEYIEGTNIRDLVTRNAVLPIDDAVFYTCELADALQHAADRGIVHRDIKPSNILIGQDSKIKLVDMGLARSENLDLSEDMTASGVTLGTFDYISPEQAKDPRDADLRSDIYSLGCTLYFMLTGSPPYPGGTMLQKLLSHGNAPPPDARALRPEVSDHMVAVIQKMLAKNPDERYQTGFDLVADLREVAVRDGLSRSQALNPVSIPQPNLVGLWLEKHVPWIAAVLLLFVIAGWLQFQSATSRDSVFVPATAVLPETGDVKPSTKPILPTTRNPRDSGFLPELEWDLGTGTGRSLRDEPTVAPEEQPGNETGQDAPGFTPVPLQGVSTERYMRFDSAAPDRGELTADENANQVAPQVIRIVSDPDVGSEFGGVLNATTLRDALVMAQEKNLKEIEIAVPEIVSEPVDLQVEDLWIRSTVSGGTVIRFEVGNAAATARESMLDVGSSDVVIEDINFVWQVPGGSVSGGSLFEINENTLLRLTDCSVTVSNPNLRDSVYAFDVIADSSVTGGATVGEPEVQIELNNVVVRGEITMLHMDEAAKLGLDWDNGLLAVSGSMIETGGTQTENAESGGRINLEFWRVTVHASAGVFRMSAAVNTPYPVAVDRQARQSIFIVDQNQPHFQFSGFPTRFQGNDLLRLWGSSNLYQVGPEFRDVMLRVESEDGTLAVTHMMDLEESPPEWVVEKSPRRSSSVVRVPREWPPAGQRVPAVYEQIDASPRGFTKERLPFLPILENNENEGLSSERTL